MSLSKKEKTLIFLLIIITIVGGFYMYILTPLKETLTENERLETEAKTEYDAAIELNQKAGTSALQLQAKKNAELQAQINKNDEETDISQTFRSEADSAFKDNYQTLAYMLKYFVANGIDISSGSVSITTYSDNGVTKFATLTVSSYVCNSGLDGLETFLNTMDEEMSFKITSLSVVPSEVDHSVSGALTMTITIAKLA